jgi:ankyrin repeat protein
LHSNQANTFKMLLLLDFPSELLLCIAEKLQSLRDINAFTQTNIRLSMLLDPYLYRCDAEDTNWAIYWAAIHGKRATATKYLEARRYAKCLSTSQKPLFEAIRNGHHSIVELLLGTEGINLNLKGSDGHTPLSLAVAMGHERVVKLLLATDSINPNNEEPSGWTPLTIAVSEGKEQIDKLFLDAGVNPNSGYIYGHTLLPLAAREGHEGIVKLLLAINGIDPNRKAFAHSPLSLAAVRGHEGVVKLLAAANRLKEPLF